MISDIRGHSFSDMHFSDIQFSDMIYSFFGYVKHSFFRYPFSDMSNTVFQIQDEGRDAELTDAIVAKFQALRSKGADFLLVVGTNSIPSLQAKGHMDLAEALGIETIGVHSLEDVDPKDVTHNVNSTLSGMDHPPPTIILNQIPEGTDMAGLAEALNKRTRKTSPLAMLPRSKVMSQVLPQSLCL